MILRRGCVAVFSIICCAALATAAQAARGPTAGELRGIASASHAPARCLYVRVSSVDRRFAKVAFRTPPTHSCAPRVANGETILRRRARRWRVLLAFSSDIRCPVVGLPSGVARDLRVCP